MGSATLLAAHLDHRRTYDDFYYVYPVVSRRSQGISLGLNINPDKICNFDCAYCEVDRVTPARRKDVDLTVLEQELREMIRLYQEGTLFQREPFASVPPAWRRLNDFAFSGDGEPTTCPVFEQAVEVAWRVRAELGLAETKLILISDAACLDRPGVQRGLDLLAQGTHEIWAKLDAGTESYYQMVNRSRVPFARILQNITQTAQRHPLIIQSLFLRVFGVPPGDQEIIAYTEQLRRIVAEGGNILQLQLYTVARPTAESWATALKDEELNRLAALVQEKTGLPQQISYGNAT